METVKFKYQLMFSLLEVFVGVLSREDSGEPLAGGQLVLAEHQLPAVIRGEVVQHT